jgi:thiol:disulfide interchange protein DsbD
MRKIGLIIALIALTGLAVFAQTEEPILKADVVAPAESLKPGRTAILTLDLNIRPPFHINSDQPSEDYLIGTTVDFKARKGVTFGRIVFPPSQMKKFGYSDNPLSVFEGTIKVTVEVILAPDFKDKEIVIEGTVGYQACDDQSCQPPTDAPFKKALPVDAGAASNTSPEPGADKPKPDAPKDVPAPVSPAAENVKKSEELLPAPGAGAIEPQKTVDSAGKASVPSVQSPAAGADFGKKGLLLTFLLVFVGGLALNLTPCIYPLIPITISYFGGQAEGKKGGVVLHSFIYVLGMAMTYSILGVVAAFTGSLFGVALTYPPVLIAIALVMVALSLSMFDVYEFRMPAFLNKAAGTSKKGFFGSFFMGLTVGIIAAPCIGPFVLGLLTYVGNQKNVVLGFSLFFVLAMGLGVPFLLLGIFSGSINKIPRSGAWMVWVRRIFGFILIAMALYFVKSLFPNPLYYNLGVALTALVGGIHLAWIEPTQGSGKVFLFIRNVFGVAFFILALVFAVSGIRGYVDEELNAKLQGLSAAGGTFSLNAVVWEPYTEEALAGALRTGKPVFIDSTADWCIACHEMDKKTYSQPEIIAESKKFVMLRADLTRNSDERVKAFYKKFNAKGAPTLIFLKPDGVEIPELRGVGFEGQDVFLAKMKKALAAGGLE